MHTYTYFMDVSACVCMFSVNISFYPCFCHLTSGIFSFNAMSASSVLTPAQASASSSTSTLVLTTDWMFVCINEWIIKCFGWQSDDNDNDHNSMRMRMRTLVSHSYIRPFILACRTRWFLLVFLREYFVRISLLKPGTLAWLSLQWLASFFFLLVLLFCLLCEWMYLLSFLPH